MQEWQKKALELWPEYRQDIEESAIPSELWLLLWSEFVAIAYGTREEVALRRFYMFASWNLEQSEETAIAAVLHFYERLPDYERVREDIPVYMSAAEVESIQPVWRYGRSEEEFQALLREIQDRRAGKHHAAQILPRRAFKGISSSAAGSSC